MNKWRLSVGTAGAVGLRKLKTDALPTTAYIMLGEKCLRNCAFCAQARESSAAAKYLSRVTWQEEDVAASVEHIIKAYQDGRIGRACLQVVNRPDSLQTIQEALRALCAGGVPTVVSGYITSVAEAGALLAWGADRLGLAVDVATEQLYGRIKGGSWERRWQLLGACAAAYPGKLTTHLIVGLGETEREMLVMMNKIVSLGVTVGLFAFTPLRGTAMAAMQPPPLDSYRRLQIALALLKKGIKVDKIKCSEQRITEFAVDNIFALLADGEAFRTTGCSSCNRPYYNERPGGILYNYPRPLTSEEVLQALRESGVVECWG